MGATETREAVTQFFAREAMLLDQGEYDEWFKLLDKDVTYLVPLRLGSYARKDEFPEGAYRQLDDYLTLGLRVERSKSAMGYAEAPNSRTVRSVSSIYIASEGEAEISVSSALILYRSRANDMHGDTIHARRDDTLRKTSEGLKLLSRTIYLADVSLGTPNLGIFL